MKHLLILCALLLSTQPGDAADKRREAAPRLPDDLKIINDIVFKEVGGKKLDLMLFQPLVKKYEKAPLVVYIHGGGWGGGDKYKVLRNDIISVIRSLNQAGFVCASIEYRLADGKPTLANDSVTDCKDAVRYLVKHAREYGIDSEHIGAFGSSAGGHLTLVMALGKDSDYPCDPALDGPAGTIRCVAAYYPLVSFVDAECMKGGNFERPQRMIPLLGGLSLLADVRYSHLLGDSRPAALLAGGHCVTLNLPAPERFVWHKLYASASRVGFAEKSVKDTLQAATLAAVLVEQDDAEIAVSLRDVPQTMVSAIKARLPALRRLLVDHPQTLAQFELALAADQSLSL